MSIDWLEKSKEFLEKNGAIDLHFLLETMYVKKVMSFVSFLSEASDGTGITVSEGHSYSLDQDWDDPDDFDEVSFFHGEMESSSISPEKFIQSLEHIASNYIESEPTHKDIVYEKLNLIKKGIYN